MTGPTLDERLPRYAALVLRAGLGAATLLILVGLALSVAQGAASIHLPAARFALADVGRGLLDLNGPSYVLLGITVLLFTPLVRVALSFGVFLVERNPDFAAITGAVFAILILSVSLGIAL